MSQHLRHLRQSNKSTYDFLGLDSEFLPASINDVVIPPRSDQPRSRSLFSLRAEIAQDAVEVGRLVPEIDLELWPSVTSPSIKAVPKTAV